MREFSALQADDLYELVTERAGRSLVITANRAAGDWYPLFPNPVVAESILVGSSTPLTTSTWRDAATGPPGGLADAPRSPPHDRTTGSRPVRARICAGPGCTALLIRRSRGRPALYCSAACRLAAHPQASRPTLDHRGRLRTTEASGRPAGHVWAGAPASRRAHRRDLRRPRPTLCGVPGSPDPRAPTTNHWRKEDRCARTYTRSPTGHSVNATLGNCRVVHTRTVRPTQGTLASCA
jgi:hypothetical protein